MIKDKNENRGFGIKLKSLIENKDVPHTEVPDDFEEILNEITEAWKEARTYDDLHLYQDHFSWLKNGFDEGFLEFPDDYDFDTNRWLIGFSLAQIERYGGVVMDTDKGTIPYTPFPKNIPDKKKKKEPITER